MKGMDADAMRNLMPDGFVAAFIWQLLLGQSWPEPL